MINPFDFDQLISPVSSKEFFEKYWEKKPLVLNKKRKGYQDFLTLKEMDFLLFSLISNTMGVKPWVRFFNNKKRVDLRRYLNENGSFNRPKVMTGFKEGNTIELIHPEDRYEPIRKLCGTLERAIGHKIYSEVFLTPPNAQGFGAHVDAYDVFVLQLDGKKHWKIYDLTMPLPIVSNSAPFKGELPKPTYEIDLKKGDFLYLPRGFVHEAYTTDELSLHISVGVDTIKWIDLINLLMANEVEFRKALPIRALFSSKADKINLDFIDKIQELFSDREKIDLAFKKMQTDFIKNQKYPYEVSFEHKEPQREITSDTRLKKREGMLCTFITDEDETIIHFGHEEIAGPSHIEPSIQYIIDTDSFSIKTMPNSLTESGRTVLVKTLMNAGLLVIDDVNSSI